MVYIYDVIRGGAEGLAGRTGGPYTYIERHDIHFLPLVDVSAKGKNDKAAFASHLRCRFPRELCSREHEVPRDMAVCTVTHIYIYTHTLPTRYSYREFHGVAYAKT